MGGVYWGDPREPRIAMIVTIGLIVLVAAFLVGVASVLVIGRGGHARRDIKDSAQHNPALVGRLDWPQRLRRRQKQDQKDDRAMARRHRTDAATN